MTPNRNEDNYIFVEIMISNRLCRLWHLVEKKFIIYNTITNKFTLSAKVIEYNDIDILNDIDYSGDTNTEYTLFIKDGEVGVGWQYNLAYYKTSDKPEIYLHPSDPSQIGFYNVTVLDGSYSKVGKYKDTALLNNVDANLGIYEDYCKEACKSNNSIQNNLLDKRTYEITEDNGDMFVKLGDYSITIKALLNMNDDNSSDISKYSYFEITSENNAYIKNLPVRKFKEKNNLLKIFSEINRDESLKMNIVTVAIEGKNFNIITWKNEKRMIGRFEDRFDTPDNYIGPPLPIIYDGNNIKLDKRTVDNEISYIFTTYTNPPRGSYIKMDNLPLKIINKFKVSLFHIDNSSGEPDEILSDLSKSKKSSSLKIITTCAWGDCNDPPGPENHYFENLEQEEAQIYLGNINALESTYGDYKQMGGKLDPSMIQFIKNVSTIDSNKISTTEYVDNKSSYYEKPLLLDISFKKNDIIELHKVFGRNGWTNSYNSIYSKTIFTINKPINEITDLDYYDSFRNIYPVSWLERKFAVNLENMWKYNNWFEDNPHFRSLPNWKFELVQAIETRNASESTLKINLGGSIFNKMTFYSFLKNPIVIFIIIIIGIFIVLKVFKKF